MTRGHDIEITTLIASLWWLWTCDQCVVCAANLTTTFLLRRAWAWSMGAQADLIAGHTFCENCEPSSRATPPLQGQALPPRGAVPQDLVQAAAQFRRR